MILKKATYKAIKYACMNFHYAKAVPVARLAYNVYNKENEWCGCVVFGGGANYRLGDTFNLTHGQYLELTRMALNGKQESTSQVLGRAIKLAKKDCPSLQLLISYADKGQNHKGIIYKATNWILIDETDTSGWEVFYKGKWRHDRIIANVKNRENIPKRKKSGKYKYVFPLNKKMKELCLPMKID